MNLIDSIKRKIAERAYHSEEENYFFDGEQSVLTTTQVFDYEQLLADITQLEQEFKQRLAQKD